jgi:cysteine synthase
MKIIHSIDEKVLAKTVARCRERHIIIPTFAEQKDPTLVPAAIVRRLADVGLWDVDPINLFRITWKNDPATGGYGAGNWVELPPALTGVQARIVGLVGKYFPTGAHKVGAGFGCLVPRLVSGNFDPTSQKAVWPSTGNYCRGGAFDCALLAAGAVAILPEGMSRERFEWLRAIGAEVIATPGCESNVKEIYDKCWEIRATRPDCVIFNQFEELGNPIWHYHVTGSIVREVFERIARPGDRLAAWISATGSAGTIAAGDFLRKSHPLVKVVATEALQCPTLLLNGFGDHRIEGIGDKHVPWVHNVRNTDVVAAIDDEQTISLLRLFNEPAGAAVLAEAGVDSAIVEKLPLLGEVLRSRPERRAVHAVDRLGRTVQVAPRRAAHRARRVHARSSTAGPRSLPRGGRGRSLRGARLPGSQAAPQPEVLHVGGAAGQIRRRAPRFVEQRLLGRSLRAGRRVGRSDPAVQ